MADRKYTIGRPLQEVRLRNWTGGRVAQMKRAVEMLEEQLNTTMASQIDQGAKRVVSTRVPKITGVAIATGFKSFSITFNEARGISDLLFYEVQKDSTSSFADPTTYTITQTSLTIPTTTEREVIYVRVRAMNSKFQVGPWSASSTATGSSNFRINVERAARTTYSFGPAEIDTWTDITSVSITVGTSAISCSIQPGARAYIDTTPATRPPGAARDHILDFVVKFRLLKDGIVDEDIGTFILYPSARVRNDTGGGGDEEQREDETTFGTVITPLESLDNVTRTYTLQAFFDGTNSSYQVNGANTAFVNGPQVIVDNFDIMEIIQST